MKILSVCLWSKQLWRKRDEYYYKLPLQMDEDFSGCEKENDSDTGFDSQGSSEGPEENEGKELKRKRSISDDGSQKKKGKKLRKLHKENEQKKLFKPPTADELNRLRETENLFHSNLFRMQIDEMLKEVQIKQKRKLEFDAWYDKFSDWIMKVEDNENKYDINDQEWLKKYKIKIPILQRPYFVKGTYQFKKPTRVGLIGSYATGLSIGPKIEVDIAVEMPQSFFQKEDYLNCRYHRKRSLYLCELVHHIQLLPNLVEKIFFISETTDSLKPKLQIIPFGKFNKYFTVLVHLIMEEGTYKLNRFSPSKNNVRRNWYFKEAVVEKEIAPTPFYNSTVVSDLTTQENLRFLKETLLMHNNIRDGIILLKIWLKQRELDSGVSGFNGFVVAMLICHLVQIKKLNVLMSSYQIFRNVCHYLVECDWTTNGITLCHKNYENLPTMTEFHEHHHVVFADVSGFHNLCFAMSPSLFKTVKHEAQIALDCLNNPNINSFQVLFITKVPFYQHYDHIVLFYNEEVLENIVDVYCTKQSQLSYCAGKFNLLRESVLNLLIKGLGKRISQMSGKIERRNTWKVDKKYKQTLVLTVGFNLDSENYFSVVDKAAESETESFREFWGDKSELRRFQDGTITEAVVWSGRTLSEKRLICKEILTYLMKTKFSLDNGDFHYLADQLDLFISPNVEESSLKVLETFDQLVKQLRNLNNLPLDVVSVQGGSPVFRYTEVFPPVPQKQRETAQKRNSYTHALIKVDLNSCPPWISPINVTIQMAASNKWPQDLEAIRRVRAAFNIKISDSLASQHGIISESFQDKIELIKSGFVFRMKVVYPNEISLLKQTVDADGLIKYKDNEKSLAFEKEAIHLPKLTSAFHGLYQEHNSFGPACAIVKRWISSHLIDSFYMSEESIELLVASLYLRPQPHQPPHQPQVAFFRFLYLLTTTNWNTECIILNINNELTRSEIIEIESDFTTNRATLPVVFIATPYDRNKSIWTKDSPTPLMLLRLMELCSKAIIVIEQQIYSKTLFEAKVLFQPCLDSYDVIITLDELFVPRKNFSKSIDLDSFPEYLQKIPINGFDPVSLYLRELRENYGSLALFFHDTYGGSVIALIWKPSSLEPCDFKVAGVSGRKLNQKTKKLELNKDAILEDFWHIGKNLVKQIDVKVNGNLQKFMSINK